jgi:hypothetical protein
MELFIHKRWVFQTPMLFLFIFLMIPTRYVYQMGKMKNILIGFLLWVMPKEWGTPEVSGPSPWAGNYFVNSLLLGKLPYT